MRILSRQAGATRAWPLLALVVALGCAPPAPRLLVATTWTFADRRSASEQLDRAGRGLSTQPPVIDWLVLDPGLDLTRLFERPRFPDALVGLDSFQAAELAAQGDFTTFQAKAGPASRDAEDPAGPIRLETIYRIARARASQSLQADYPALVQWAADLTNPSARDLSPAGWGLVPRDGSQAENAAFLMQALGYQPAELVEPPAGPEESATALTVAALLDSVLIEARPELEDAGRALRAAGPAPGLIAFLTEPPPWPPASVRKLLDRPDRSGDELILRLAESIVPDPGAREDLLRSWLAPARPLDCDRLRALAAGGVGTLLNEPRLEDWLRAEWTAWARQRFRRVARQARAKEIARP